MSYLKKQLEDLITDKPSGWRAQLWLESLGRKEKVRELHQELYDGLEESVFVAIENDIGQMLSDIGREELTITIEKNNSIYSILLWRDYNDLVSIHNVPNSIYMVMEEAVGIVWDILLKDYDRQSEVKE